MNQYQAPGVYADDTGEPLLRINAVAHWLGISRPGVYGLINRGKLRPFYLDARPSFDPADIRRLIAEATRESEARGR